MTLRKYNAAATVLFPLITRDAADLTTAATFAAGDTQLSKDEGAFANAGSNPVHEGNGIYSLALTATELQAARVVVTVKDQSSPKVWEDQAVIIDTYGNASAQHELDLDVATPAVNVTQWRGSTPNILNSSGDVLVDVRRVKDALIADLTAGFVQADVRNWLGVNPNALSSGRVDAVLAATAAQAAADELLKRAISNVEPSATARTLYGAVAALVNRRRINAGNLEVYKTDDATVLATLAATTDAAQQPIKELDP